MSTWIEDYKGYAIRLAAFQPSKVRRGGHTRSVQIVKKEGFAGLIVKSIRYDFHKGTHISTGTLKKAREWIDQHPVK